ncbi:SDR family NAD(P)-dependent oxidoreductase [Algoriphagus sp. AK58]|uniref:SDR family NAD(P)-dependent oxidoreductase n=1 Tax=Algoriphagus sp. AK58 TaxID=1406877 RepID=UPI0016506FC9|nr:SDR family NAD(P)-dependent oxidoreductase [Algoriphagus sp. AK58]MBC6366450.1 short-chain dehydrogenase [Algoriphagus sp. AK58]
MSRNIIITGAAGALGGAVVEKFKREGYHVIALVKPDANEVAEEADVTYEVDVTDEKAVADFVKEYQIQFGELDAIAMIVGGFAMGSLESTTQKELNRMFQLNFFSAFSMVSGFLPLFKKQMHGTFLFVGARPALQLQDATSTVAYSLSKKLVISLSEIVAEEVKGTDIRTHVFVPSIIDTPANREAMPDSDFGKWVNPADIAEAMHYALNTPSLRQMTFKLYGGV